MLADSGRLQFSDPGQHLTARSPNALQIEITFRYRARMFFSKTIVTEPCWPGRQAIDVASTFMAFVFLT
jgi:hypothetical protein